MMKFTNYDPTLSSQHKRKNKKQQEVSSKQAATVVTVPHKQPSSKIIPKRSITQTVQTPLPVSPTNHQSNNNQLLGSPTASSVKFYEYKPKGGSNKLEKTSNSPDIVSQQQATLTFSQQQQTSHLVKYSEDKPRPKTIMDNSVSNKDHKNPLDARGRNYADLKVGRRPAQSRFAEAIVQQFYRYTSAQLVTSSSTCTTQPSALFLSLSSLPPTTSSQYIERLPSLSEFLEGRTFRKAVSINDILN